MSLQEHFRDFGAFLCGLASDAPDEYRQGSYRTYASDRKFLLDSWEAIIQVLGKEDLLIQRLDNTLNQAIAALDEGEKVVSRGLLWGIYNDDLKLLGALVKTARRKKNIKPKLK